MRTSAPLSSLSANLIRNWRAQSDVLKSDSHWLGMRHPCEAHPVARKAPQDPPRRSRALAPVPRQEEAMLLPPPDHYVQDTRSKNVHYFYIGSRAARLSAADGRGHKMETTGCAGQRACEKGWRFMMAKRCLRDYVASLQRWMKRDAIGQTIDARLRALEAPDDRTIVSRLLRASSP